MAYTPCKNGDWLLFAPGDGVMHRVMEISLHVCVAMFDSNSQMVSTKPSESSVMPIMIGNTCHTCLYLNR